MDTDVKVLIRLRSDKFRFESFMLIRGSSDTDQDVSKSRMQG